MKSEQKKTSGLFKPSAMWQLHIDKDYKILKESVATNDLNKFMFFLSNFGNWKDYLGIENNTLIKEYSKNQGMTGNIDLACIAVGAASEYPQCFPDIDRQYEKTRIIDSSLNTFSDQLNILENKYFFPAGGTYIIPGKFSSLNDYVAQPVFEQLESTVISSDSCKNIYYLEGGNSVEKIDGKWLLSGAHFSPLHGGSGVAPDAFSSQNKR